MTPSSKPSKNTNPLTSCSATQSSSPLPQELHLPPRNPPRLRLHRQPPHLTGPPRRPLRRKHNPPLGTNASMLCGVFCETMALIGASLSKQIWHLYLSFGICLGWSIGLQCIATVGIVPQWFNRRRAVASGIGAAGSGTGGLIYTLATNAMINHFGISWTYGILCIIRFVVNTTCALLIRNRNRTVGTRQVAINKTLFRRPEYWLLLSWGFLSILGFEVLLFSLPDYANSIGLTAQQGTVAAALLNLGRGVGKPAIGYFSDGVGRINMASIMSLICRVPCLAMWIPAKDYGALLAFSLFGGVTGTFWTASPLCKPSIMISNIYPPGRRPHRHRRSRPPRSALLPNNDVDGPSLPSSLCRPNCPPTAQTRPP
jgi:MFS family permease